MSKDRRPNSSQPRRGGKRSAEKWKPIDMDHTDENHAASLGLRSRCVYWEHENPGECFALFPAVKDPQYFCRSCHCYKDKRDHYIGSDGYAYQKRHDSIIHIGRELGEAAMRGMREAANG